MTDAAIGDLLSAARPRSVAGHTRNVHTLSWDTKGGALLASGSDDNNVKIWALDQSASSREVHTLSGHTKGVNQVTWDPSKAHSLASASEDATLKFWDASSGKCVNTLKTPGENINLAWSPNGHMVAVGNKNDVVCIVDVRTRRVMQQNAFAYEVNELQWSPTSRFLFMATGQNSRGQIQVMSVAPPWSVSGTGTPTKKKTTGDPAGKLTLVKDLFAHTASCYCLRTDPTGRYMATGSADSLVSLWALDELMCERTFGGLDWPVRSIGFSHEGRFLAAATEEGGVEVTAVASGARVGMVKGGVPVNSVAWHPRQYILAIAGEERERDEGLIRLIVPTTAAN